MSGLEDWIAIRRAEAVRAMRAAISATQLEHRRQAFGQVVRPAPGSVVASTRRARWDPEPDYFHHWPRDAAVVMRRVPRLIAAAADAAEAEDWRRCFSDWVRFSCATTDPDRPPLAVNPLRKTTRPEARRFLRSDAELAALGGATLLEEPRVGADGGPDLENWARPQFDGAALRASTCIAALTADPTFASDDATALVERDLAFTVARAGDPCIGPWEEPPARRDVFTLIAQWDALSRGAIWRRAAGGSGGALDAAARRVAALVETAWDPGQGCWRAFLGGGPDDVDAAVIVALVEADRRDGPFATGGERAADAAAALAARFAALYPINRDAETPLIGRWPGDVFFGGNPWLPTTLAFATLRYQRGEVAAGDAVMARLRAVMPAEGFPEQLDRATGAPTSCRALTWSAAAFLAAAEAREDAQGLAK